MGKGMFVKPLYLFLGWAPGNENTPHFRKCFANIEEVFIDAGVRSLPSYVILISRIPPTGVGSARCGNNTLWVTVKFVEELTYMNMYRRTVKKLLVIDYVLTNFRLCQDVSPFGYCLSFPIRCPMIVTVSNRGISS